MLALVLTLLTTPAAVGQESDAPREKDPAAQSDDPGGAHDHDAEDCTLRSGASRSERHEWASCIGVAASLSRPPSVGEVVTLTMDVRADAPRGDAEVTIELSDNLAFAEAPAGTTTARGPSLDGPGQAQQARGRRDLAPDNPARLTARIRAVAEGPATIHLRTVADAPHGGTDAGADHVFLTVGGESGPARFGFDTPTEAGTVPVDAPPAAAEPANLQPSPGVPAEDEVASAGTLATSCITGSWHFTDNNGVLKPNRNYQVRAVQSTGTVLATGVTSHSGAYTLCFDGTGNKSVRATFISENSRWRVRNTAAANENYVNSTGLVTVNDGATHNFGALVPGNDINRGMHAFYSINDFWNWKPGGTNNCWDALDAPAACRQMIINWTPTSTDGTYYSLGGNDIHLAAADPDAPHTTIHEGTHAVMDDVYEDNYPSSPNCNPHSVTGASSTGCAWTEGFAEWVPAAVLNDPFYRWPNGASLNLETPTWGSTGWDSGDAVEGRVAGAMIDISDFANEQYWDRYGEGDPSNQWTTFLNNNNSATFSQFFNTHRAAGGFNVAHTGARANVYQNTIDYNFRDPLGNYAPLTRPTPNPHNFSYPTTTNYWSAVGVRPPAGADYDLRLYNDFAMSTLLKSSAFGGSTIDFVAVDSNAGRRALQTYYPRASLWAGAGEYQVEVAQGAQTVYPGTHTIGFSTSNVLAVRDAFLTAGTRMFFRAVPQAGQSVDAFLMRSDDLATAIRSRGEAALSALSAGNGQPVGFSYDTPLSSWHGLVLTQRAGSGNVTVYVDTSAPTGSVAINGGDATTYDHDVTLDLSATDAHTGVDLMRVAVDGVVDSEPEEPFAATKNVTLPASPGPHTVAVRYRNQAGMWSTDFTSTITVPASVADFTGDGATDLSVYRPSVSRWYVIGQSAQTWGTSGDVSVPGDYDGDGDVDIAVYRPSISRWYVMGQPAQTFGVSGDVPVPADYDGDGDVDIAVYRPSVSRWYVMGQPAQTWGTSGDVPVPGDYDGDGDTDIAVYRPSNGRWYVVGESSLAWGTSSDVPVPADYDGDGDTDIAVFRSSTGRWYVMGQPAQTWGTSGDVSVPGDYDGDGDTDIAVFRPSTGRWYVMGESSQAWGVSDDVPLPLPHVIYDVYFAP